MVLTAVSYELLVAQCEPCASACLSFKTSVATPAMAAPVLPRMQAVEAMRLGNEAAKFVSAAFPNPMELKFERVAHPFLLLHVNRCLHMLGDCWLGS